MQSSTVKEELLEEVDRLQPDDQQRVLDFARALVVSRPKGSSVARLLEFAGTIEPDDLDLMEQAINESRRQSGENAR